MNIYTSFPPDKFTNEILFLFLIVILSGCSNNDHIKGNGKEALDKRETATFNAIEIQGNYEVKLIEGDEENLEVIADENIIPHINTEVVDNTLKISNKVKIKNKENVKINIYYNKLKSLHCGGASSIKSDFPVHSKDLVLSMSGTGLIDIEIISKMLELNLSGTGLIKLSGHVEKEVLNLSGAGKLNASNLKSKDCNIQLSGIGSAQLHVEDHLDAHLSGVGGITYRGNPTTVHKDIAGIGTIDIESNYE